MCEIIFIMVDKKIKSQITHDFFFMSEIGIIERFKNKFWNKKEKDES